jgi:hypothetical protein
MSIDQQYALADVLIYFGAFGLIVFGGFVLDAIYRVLRRF